MIQVSVIIPNYNHARFLKQRIESVLNQTWQNFDVVILDDCSTDNSKEVIEVYRQHPKVSQVVYNETNSGSTSVQWYKGLMLAKGEYIWIAESDDVADVHFIEKMMLLLLRDNTTGIAYCRTMEIDEAGNETGLHYWPDALDDKRWTNSYWNTGINELRNYFLYRNIIVNASSAVFKKDIALPAIEYVARKNMKFCGDWLFYSRMLTSSNISYCPEALNFQRFHPSTTRVLKTNDEELRRMGEYIDCVKDISKFLEIKVNLLDKRYNWIYQYSFENMPLSFKLSKKFIHSIGDRRLFKKMLLNHFVKNARDCAADFRAAKIKTKRLLKTNLYFINNFLKK
ncbi:MAG TPA: glycosyltransferase family 2 protein [Parafilimonas sp.]|nr:glycosyltransferase family 2 protein [Parafilimonas sp.]